MTLDLEERLHAYRPTLDEAIGETGQGAAFSARRRPRRRVPLAVAALIAIAGGAGLMAAIDRDDAGPSTATEAPSVRFPYFVLEDPDFVPVEFAAYISATVSAGSWETLTYLARAESAETVDELRIEVVRGDGSIGTANAERVVVRGHDAVARRIDNVVEVSWFESSARIKVIVSGDRSIDEVVALTERLRPARDADWAVLVDEIMTTDLPPEFQQWRDWRAAQTGNPPISFGFAVG